MLYTISQTIIYILLSLSSYSLAQTGEAPTISFITPSSNFTTDFTIPVTVIADVTDDSTDLGASDVFLKANGNRLDTEVIETGTDHFEFKVSKDDISKALGSEYIGEVIFSIVASDADSNVTEESATAIDVDLVVSKIYYQPWLFASEIFIDPPGRDSDSGGEWIEVVNLGADIDLTEVEIIDGNTTKNIALINGSKILSSNGIAIISKQSASFVKEYSDYSGQLFASPFILNNDKDDISFIFEDVNIGGFKYSKNEIPEDNARSLEFYLTGIKKDADVSLGEVSFGLPLRYPEDEVDVSIFSTKVAEFQTDCDVDIDDLEKGVNEFKVSNLPEGESFCEFNILDSIGAKSNVLSYSFYVDTVSPALADVTPIDEKTVNKTPTYVFSTNEAGRITYEGSCSSITTEVERGNNSIAFDTLTAGLKDDCVINVEDYLGNSSSLNVPSFRVVQKPGSISNLVLTPALTSIASSWDAPINTGGDDEIEYIFSFAKKGETFQESTQTTRTKELTSLDSSTAYSVRVSASNFAGSGPLVNKEATTLSPAKPSGGGGTTPTPDPIVTEPDPIVPEEVIEDVVDVIEETPAPTTTKKTRKAKTSNLILLKGTSLLPGFKFLDIGDEVNKSPKPSFYIRAVELKTDLYLNSVGSEVSLLQEYLIGRGYLRSLELRNGSVYFGDETKTALSKYQEANREVLIDPFKLITPTGYLDKITRLHINMDINNGHSQRILNIVSKKLEELRLRLLGK